MVTKHIQTGVCITNELLKELFTHLHEIVNSTAITGWAFHPWSEEYCGGADELLPDHDIMIDSNMMHYNKNSAHCL